ncbi:hypothetical protein [uncultured Enterovirga sp.]|uniref:hypothetical protein n=1 Tax=uncultured Enterovirga sp. TaxID=2026352 RepID=UPI0035C9E59B
MPPADHIIAEPRDPDLGFFAYLLALSEQDNPPDMTERARPGDLRRKPGGAYWIFNGEAWIEW